MKFMDDEMRAAVKAHREMWRGIAAECRRQKHQVYKMDYIKMHGLDESMENYDPLCDYISKRYTKAKRVVHNVKKRKPNSGGRAASDCSLFCPLDFGQSEDKAFACSHTSPIGDWAECDYFDWERAAEIAERFANAPLLEEREVEVSDSAT